VLAGFCHCEDRRRATGAPAVARAAFGHWALRRFEGLLDLACRGTGSNTQKDAKNASARET